MTIPTHSIEEMKDPKEITSVTLGTSPVSLEEFIAVARYHAKVEFSPQMEDKITSVRKLVEKYLEDSRPIYGVTTGCGDNVRHSISKENAKQLQLNIIRSHSTGVGEPLDEECVRAIMFAMLTNARTGFSGVSLPTITQIKELLNRGVVPFVPGEGCIAGLSVEGHIALVLVGEGYAYVDGKKVPGAEALAKASLSPITLGTKEGLDLLNGCLGAIGLSALALYNTIQCMKSADIASAYSFETLKGTKKALDPRLMAAKCREEQADTAKNLLHILEGSEIIDANTDRTVQDPYVLRCAAQMSGADKRVIKEAYRAICEEFNSCCDNPVIIPDETGEDGVALMEGNFDGSYTAMHMDSLCIAMAHLGKMCERRTDRLVNRHFSDYPGFLVKNPGLNSGYMITHYTSATLLIEIRSMLTPSSGDSIPVSANQEDPNTFTYVSAMKAYQCSRKLEYIVGIELMTQAQAKDFITDLKSAPVIEKVHSRIRSEIPTVEEDRYFYPDMEKIKDMVHEGTLVKTVEKEIGHLLF